MNSIPAGLISYRWVFKGTKWPNDLQSYIDVLIVKVKKMSPKFFVFAAAVVIAVAAADAKAMSDTDAQGEIRRFGLLGHSHCRAIYNT